MWIGQTKNNIANILQLYAFTQKKKKKKQRASKTVKVKQTKTIVTKLL